MTSMINSVLRFVTILIVLLAVHCQIAPNASLGGSSSEVDGKIVGTIIDSCGIPVEGAIVILRPSDYLPKEPFLSKLPIDNTAMMVCSTLTDNSGRYRFTADDLHTGGLYCIEARDREHHTCLFIDSIPVCNDFLASNTWFHIRAPRFDNTLKSPDTITATVFIDSTDSKMQVNVFGLGLSTSIDKGGTFRFTDVPPGRYRLQIVTMWTDTTCDTIVIPTHQRQSVDNGDTIIPTPYFNRIIYNGNGHSGGTVPVDRTTYDIGDEVVVRGNTGELKKNFYTFSGWNTRKDGTGLSLNDGTTFIKEKTVDVLYAQWIIVQPEGMVKIPAEGTSFAMGNNYYLDEIPVHTVSFSNDFMLDTVEVTRGDYDALMASTYLHYATPSWNSIILEWNQNDTPHHYDTITVTDQYPVTVNWYDAVLYCNARTKAMGCSDTVYQYDSIIGTSGNKCLLENLRIDLTKEGFHLPTEAQWEYACRAGSVTDFYNGSTNPDTLYVWKSSYMHPVAQKLPNGFGFYDMCGNAPEWCNDYYDVYDDRIDTDPTGPLTGTLRVCRGSDLRISQRRGYECTVSIGFRVCKTIKR